MRIGAALVLVCSSAFQHQPAPTRPSQLAPRAAARVQLPRLCELSFADARVCRGALKAHRRGSSAGEGDTHETSGSGGAARRGADRALPARGDGAGWAAPRGDRRAPDVDPGTGAWGVTGVDRERAAGGTRTLGTRTLGTRTLEGLQRRWGVEHGSQSIPPRFAQLSKLRARGEGAGAESVSDEEVDEKLHAACEAYPQRWRVEGAARYEETSTLRFLDGWAETFPAVVDASSGDGKLPTRIPFLFGTKRGRAAAIAILAPPESTSLYRRIPFLTGSVRPSEKDLQLPPKGAGNGMGQEDMCDAAHAEAARQAKRRTSEAMAAWKRERERLQRLRYLEQMRTDSAAASASPLPRTAGGDGVGEAWSAHAAAGVGEARRRLGEDAWLQIDGGSSAEAAGGGDGGLREGGDGADSRFDEGSSCHDVEIAEPRGMCTCTVCRSTCSMCTRHVS